MSEEERQRLANEIALRESQVAEMRSEVDQKTYETNLLQREVEDARRRQEHKEQQNHVHQHHVQEHHVQEHRTMLKEHNGHHHNDVDHDDLTNAHIGRLKDFLYIKKWEITKK